MIVRALMGTRQIRAVLHSKVIESLKSQNLHYVNFWRECRKDVQCLPGALSYG